MPWDVYRILYTVPSPYFPTSIIKLSSGEIRLGVSDDSSGQAMGFSVSRTIPPG
jgi:hypothetical protein